MAVVAFNPYSNSILKYMYSNDYRHTQHLLSEERANRLMSPLDYEGIISQLKILSIFVKFLILRNIKVKVT